MPDAKRDVLITGIGIVSCLGEGIDAHWHALSAAPPKPDTASYPQQIEGQYRLAFFGFFF